MRDLKTLRRAIISTIAPTFVLFGTVVITTAQNQNAEYREWQKAQQQVQKEQRDYMRSRNARDYREWQDAQRRAQEEYLEYQRSINNPSYRNNDRVYGGGYYNNNRNRRYRVYRDGSYYSTDQRGAELLRQAVRNGYSQGYRQGQMDRRYGRSNDYYDDNLYRSGTYGYQSNVERGQYQHYFQQGYQRGYEDGYNSTRRYGNGTNILGGILNTILNLTVDN